MKNYERILVIGDIHGEFVKLMSLYKKINVTENDLIIFLGDYVDRGSENVKTLKWIMNESKKENVIALCGNHEDMLATDISAGYVNKYANGTLKEIALQKLKEPDFDEKVLKFIKNLPFTFEMEIGEKKYFFCHAGINPNFPFENQSEDDLIWIRAKFFTLYDGNKIMVVGHNPVMFLKSDEEIQSVLKNLQSLPENCRKTLEEIIEEITDDEMEEEENLFFLESEEAMKVKNCKPQWRSNGKILMMDTGAFMPNGYISCIDLMSGKIWQSD